MVVVGGGFALARLGSRDRPLKRLTKTIDDVRIVVDSAPLMAEHLGEAAAQDALNRATGELFEAAMGLVTEGRRDEALAALKGSLARPPAGGSQLWGEVIGEVVDRLPVPNAAGT
jgi:hypothetical protein